MRLMRTRFTVRRMMAVVAIAAILLGPGLQAWRVYRNFREYKQRASQHSIFETIWTKQKHEWSSKESEWRSIAKDLEQKGKDFRSAVEIAEIYATIAENPTRLAEYHARMKEKYEAARRRPWLPVEPDPPEPK